MPEKAYFHICGILLPMKRTPLRRVSPNKVNKPKKVSKLNKVGKTSISKLKKKLWIEFSKYIRARDKNICFICGRRAEGSAYHAGHFIPKSVGGIELYFHEDNVKGCCYHCNINLGGNLYEYGMKLGKEKVDYLYSLKGKISKWTEQDYLEKIEYYKNKNE